LRVILHAGTHKTGTTSIQTALAHNRNWLSERGYVYPKLRRYAPDHNKLAHMLARGDRASFNFRSKLNAAVGHSLIISAEEFWAVTSHHEDWEEFCRPDYWQRRIERLERLRNALRDFEDIVILLCLRRQDEFAASFYATKIMSGRFQGSFEEFRSRSKPLFDYSKQLDAFHAVFDEVRYISFDALRSNLVPAFCEWADIPVPPEIPAERRLVTPDARLVQWVYKCQTTSDPERLNRLRISFATSTDAATVLPHLGKSTFWLSDAERRSFLAKCVDPEPDFFTTADTTADDDPGFLATDLLADDLSRIDDAFEAWRSSQIPRYPTPVAPGASGAVSRIWSLIRAQPEECGLCRARHGDK
jgi:hypothetical protein